MTRPGYGLQVLRLLERAIDFSLVNSTQTCCGAPSFLLNEFRRLSWKYSSRGVKLTTHLHPVLSLWMRGAIPLLPDLPLWCEQGQFACEESVLLRYNASLLSIELPKVQNNTIFSVSNVKTSSRLLDIYTPEDKKTALSRNVGNPISRDAESYSRRIDTSSTMLWES